MQKIDPTVQKETKYIAAVVIVLSAAMEAVFLVLGKWNYTVLLGNALGALAAVGNFLLMGLTIQNTLGMEAEDASKRMKLSQKLRMLMLLILAVLGVALKCFETVAVLVTLFFPRIAIALRPLLDRKESKRE